MDMINFVGGGKMGDYIHSIYAVKNLCMQRGAKANLYMAKGGDSFKYGIRRAFADTRDLFSAQPYVNKFEMLPGGFNEPMVNLSAWRVGLPRKANTGWSDLLSGLYGFGIPDEYKWILAEANDDHARGKTLVHRSDRRHNDDFPWEQVLDGIPGEILFITSNMDEWNSFKFKRPRVLPYLVPTIGTMASALASCKFFVGNQSSPFALASALDIPRLVELDYDSAGFYVDEMKYSKNISWFLNESSKYMSNSAIVGI